MDYTTLLGRIVANMEKVIVGKRREIEYTLICLLCRGHILIEDVPGTGKTSLASSLAKSLACSFKRIQFTPDIMPADITGFSVFSPKTGEFEFREGAVMSQIVLADEINRTSPKTQSSLLEAMAERQVTVEGVSYAMPRPFMVLATQNPVDSIGTYPLPEAQMDRFFMRISVGYPNMNEESLMLTRFKLENPLSRLMPVASSADITELQKQCQEIHVDERINTYIVALARHTRENPMVSLGVSPRGSLSLYKAGQAWALYNARNYVIPDDIIAMAPHVLSHRVIINQEGRLKKLSQSDIVRMALCDIRVPSV